MSKTGKTHQISEYLWCRIKNRMQSLGISNKDLAEMVGQSESNVSRMLRQDVRSIVYLDQLREALALPEDELESQYTKHAEHLQEILARVMATDASIADDFLEDVAYLGAFYGLVYDTRERVIIAEAVTRQAETPAAKKEALEQYKKLKEEEASLAKTRRQLTSILS